MRCLASEKDMLLPLRAVAPLPEKVQKKLEDVQTGRSGINVIAAKMPSMSSIVTPSQVAAKYDIINKQRSRFYTVDTDLTPSTLNPLRYGRRELYGSLPFVAAFGMGHHEHVIHDAINEAARKCFENSELEIVITLPLAFSVMMATILQFLTGYNTSVMNAPADVIFPGHTTAEWSIVVSIFAIGGTIGAYLGGVLANKYGRRGAMLAAIWLYFMGGFFLTTSPSIHWLLPSRLIIGFASGISSVVVPVYLGEIAPPTLRGTLGTFTQFANVIGVLVSVVLPMPLSTQWRWLFSVSMFLGMFQIALSSYLLESPRWLLNLDVSSSEARGNIKQLRGFLLDEEVENEVNNYVFASTRQRNIHRNTQTGETGVDSRGTAVDARGAVDDMRGAMLDMLRERSVKTLLISAVVLQMVQQLCGINAIFFYSTTFFRRLLAYPLEGTIAVAVVNVVATYVALKLMDHTPRRMLLLWSIGGVWFAAVMVVLASLNVIPSMASLLAVMLFVACFEIGLGPIPWLIVAEMFDAKYVATAMSVSCTVNWLCTFLVGLCFPFMNDWLGPYCFIPFIVVLICGFVFVYVYLPETHEKTVEEVYTEISRSLFPPSSMTDSSATGVCSESYPYSYHLDTLQECKETDSGALSEADTVSWTPRERKLSTTVPNTNNNIADNNSNINNNNNNESKEKNDNNYRIILK